MVASYRPSVNMTWPGVDELMQDCLPQNIEVKKRWEEELGKKGGSEKGKEVGREVCREGGWEGGREGRREGGRSGKESRGESLEEKEKGRGGEPLRCVV